MRNRKIGDLTKDEAFGCLLGALATTLAVSLGDSEVTTIVTIAFDAYVEEIALEEEEITRVFAEPKVANLVQRMLTSLQNAGFIAEDRRRRSLTQAARIMAKKSGEQLH